MVKKLASIILGVLCMTCLYAQKPASLYGNWQVKTYHSTLRDSAAASISQKSCANFMVLSISKKGRVKFIFTDKKDSVVFAGRIKVRKDGSVKIDHNIHESTYLGDFEKCISPLMREDMKRVFFRTFACVINKDQLFFYYSLPSDLSHKKTMVLARL